MPYHAGMNGAMVLEITGSGKSMAESSIARQITAIKTAFIGRNRMSGRILVRPGDRAANRYGNGVWRESKTLNDD